MKPEVTSRACKEVHQTNRSQWVNIRGKREQPDSAFLLRVLEGGRVERGDWTTTSFEPVYVKKNQIPFYSYFNRNKGESWHIIGGFIKKYNLPFTKHTINAVLLNVLNIQCEVELVHKVVQQKNSMCREGTKPHPTESILFLKITHDIDVGSDCAE